MFSVSHSGGDLKMMKHLLTGKGFEGEKNYKNKTFRTPAIRFSKVTSLSVPILNEINLQTFWDERICMQNIQNVLFFI